MSVNVVVVMSHKTRRLVLTGLVSVRLLDTSGGWCGLASGLGGELLARGLATSRLACDGVLEYVHEDVCCW